MSQTESFEHEPLMLRVARDLGKYERVSFTPIKELRHFSAHIGKRIVASARSTAINMVSTGEMYDLGIDEDDAIDCLEALKSGMRHNKRGGEVAYNLGVKVEIADQVEVRARGEDMHLGIPILGSSAVELSSEIDGILSSFYEKTGTDLRIEPTQDQILTVAIIEKGEREEAEELVKIANNLLFTKHNPVAVHHDAFTYAPEIEDIRWSYIKADTFLAAQDPTN